MFGWCAFYFWVCPGVKFLSFGRDGDIEVDGFVVKRWWRVLKVEAEESPSHGRVKQMSSVRTAKVGAEKRQSKYQCQSKEGGDKGKFLVVYR